MKQMKNCIMSTLLIGILLVGLPSVSAENDGGSSTLTLSIKDAIMRALDRNPDELNYKERIRWFVYKMG